MQETFELDLREIFGALMKRVWLIALASVLGFAFTYAAAKYVIPPRYTSSVSLYVNNSSEAQAMSAVNINDINASQKLVNTYAVILRDDEVLGRLAHSLLGEYSAEWLEYAIPAGWEKGADRVDTERLRKAIRMSAVNNTEILKIEAETKSAELSARICAVMTEIAPDVLMRVVKAGSVEVIGAARPADRQSSPKALRSGVTGFLAGMALAVIIVTLAHLLDNTVKDGDGLRKRYNLPILGEIPDFASSAGGERYGS